MSTAKAAPAKAKKVEGITAYNMRTKEKNVLMHDAVIDISNGRYIAKGHDGTKEQQKLTTIMGQAAAEAAIENGWATKGEGWGKAAKKK